LTEGMQLHQSDKFVIRRFRMDDLDAYVAYRNDETTAQFQSWTVPYPVDKARDAIGKVVVLEGPISGEWFTYAIADPVSDVLIGDVAVMLEWEGRSAMIGYTLAPQSRGKGIAFEATSWVINRLFVELKVQRIHAALHPDNVASMMLLERLGFLYEGTARQAYWVGDLCTDDPQFGLLFADWKVWNERLRNKPEHVELVEVTPTNRAAVFALQTHHSQRRFVSPMQKSAVDALVPDPDDDGGAVVPWFRAIVADGEIVGFVMLASPTDTNPHPFLWRLLIDRMHQRRGIGWQVLELLTKQYRASGYEKLLVSWQPGKGSPEPMYLRYGFVPTGETHGTEIVAEISLVS
jgi:RimJ/RimL family protein N-acetyltransferase